ncbi:MAG: response regulator transcription factor [bacterium]|nr:response regulator transcription factor [bacterium]
MPHRVLIVEDEPTVRAHLADSIRAHAELALVGEASTLAEGTRELEKEHPDVLLTDLGLPDGSGVALIRRCAELGGTLPLVITVFGDDGHVLDAIRAGALGYLLKSESRAGVAQAVLEVIAGGSPLSPSVARRVLSELRPPAPSPDAPRLSERELEVLRHIVKGFTYDEIADLLAISPATVATHVRKVYRKLSVHSRSEATYEALQLGIVRPDE